MAQSTPAVVARQLDHLRSSFAQQPGLPLVDLLPENTPELLGPSSDRIYTPLVTLTLFLWQTLVDGSCQAAVARLLAHLAATGQPSCSANTSGYCKARQRLPEDDLRTITRTREPHFPNEPIAAGSGKTGVSGLSTERPSTCLTQKKIKKNILNRPVRNLGSALP